MLRPAELRRHLALGAAAAFSGDAAGLDRCRLWLIGVSARELLRIDGVARQFRYGGSSLNKPQWWTNRVLSGPPVAAALASMHPDGYVRERAVRVLAGSAEMVSDRALTVRLADHVPVVRELAAREILQRTTLEQAGRIMPLLHRIEQRGRGADVLPLYLHGLALEHGESPVWACLRQSCDRDLRRAAFRYSLEQAILGTDDAIAMLPTEADQIVRRMLFRVIAERASAEVVSDVLIHARSAEGRVLGLVRLATSDLDPHDVERLLVDSSTLVRMWARRRWQEMGRDPAITYRQVTGSGAKPLLRARAYLALDEIGSPVDRASVLELVESPDRALQKAGLRLLANRARAQDVPRLVALVAGSQPRVARLASEVLAKNPALWSVQDLADLKRAPEPEIRRRAWWIHRQRGGWEAVIADLEILHDQDAHLTVLGRQPCAPMYFQPDNDQQQRIGTLLFNSELGRDEKFAVALAAGLRPLLADFKRAASESASASTADMAIDTHLSRPRPIPAQPWWRRIWDRR